MLGLAIALIQPAPIDIHRLEIGQAKPIVVRTGYTDTRTGRSVTADEVAAAADGVRFIVLGESHDNLEHHQMQAEIIRALVRRGRSVAVGFEMFTRPNQGSLANWTLGRWDEATFIERSGWKSDWNMDFALYRPIFEAVREHRLPMVALNVPRAWVRNVGRQGLTALTPEQRAELPEVVLTNQDHQKVFFAMMGGHPTEGQAAPSNIYAAMALWDEAMADSALRYMAGRPNPRAVIAIIAGKGHALYNQGIDWRIRRRAQQPTLTVIPLDAPGSQTVSSTLGDFVFVPSQPKT